MIRALGTAGAAALIGSLFLPWFEASLADAPGAAAIAERIGADLTLSGWDAMGALDVVLVLAAIAGMVSLVVLAPGPVARSLALTATGLALFVVVREAVDPPGGWEAVDARAGIALAGAGALALAVASLLVVNTLGHRRDVYDDTWRGMP